MRLLPYADPGEPDTRSPLRFLLWIGARQWPSLLAGTATGVVWMVSQALVPAAIGRGIDAGVARADVGAGARWAGVVLVLALVQAVSGVLRHRAAVNNWLQAAFRSMQLLGRHSAHAGVAVRRALPTGEVVAAATNDAAHIGEVFDISARLAGAVVSYVVVAVLLLRSSVLLGSVVLVGVPLVVLCLGPVMRPLARRQAEQRAAAGRVTALGADTVAGLRVLRGVGGEPAFFARYRDQSQELRAAGVRIAGLQASLTSAQVLLPGVFLVGVTWLAARLALTGSLTAGEVVAFYGYAFFLVVPIRTAVETADKATRSMVGARRILGVLDTPPSLTDPAEPEPLPPAPAGLFDAASGLVVEPGRFTAVAGADSEATARLADRLARFVAEGSAESVVTLGGVPLERLPLASVRRRVLVSEAEPRLFSGTVRSGLDPAGSASDSRLLAVLAAVAGEDVLEALPSGLDTVLEERGRSLSGGQRQRLVLARALLADPDVLVLVEPTSAVDAHTEARVAAGIAALREGRTTVVTTTSPLVLDRCDVVAYVEGGRVVGTGTHRRLLADSAGYRYAVLRDEEP